MTMIIGIDTGISGGMTLLHDGVLVESIETPHFWTHLKTKTKSGKYKRRRRLAYMVLADVLRDWVSRGATEIIIEQVHPMHGNGAISAFSQGEAFGAFTGISASLGLNITLVTPTQWKRVYDLLHTDKSDSLYKANSLFNGIFPKAKDHNRAESALIAACGLHEDESNLLATE